MEGESPYKFYDSWNETISFHEKELPELKLLKTVASKCVWRFPYTPLIDYDDYFQEAFLGLMDARKTFLDGQNYEKWCYIKMWSAIYGAKRRFIPIKEKNHKYPTQPKHISISVKEVTENEGDSLDEISAEVYNILIADDKSAFDRVAEKDVISAILEVIKELTLHQQMIIKSLFYDDMMDKDVAANLSIHKSAIGCYKKRIFKKLKHSLIHKYKVTKAELQETGA